MRVSKVGTVVAMTAIVLLAVAEQHIDDEEDEEGDSAPFMMMLEHENGLRCSASLVSSRTGVTTARCARGGDNVGERQKHYVWAFAPGVTSPALAARRVARVAFAGDEHDPADPALDIAVVELEAPFGSATHSRPIVMALNTTECERASICHAVHASAPHSKVGGDGGRKTHLHVVDLTKVPEKRCANVVPHWSASRDRLICLAGDKLCERDLGVGVVCGGKLCGVLNAVAGGADGCGDTFSVQNIPRWRRFLHCAHTLRLCGRGACEKLCTERQLLEEESEDDKQSAPRDSDFLSAFMESSHKSNTTIDDWTSSSPLPSEVLSQTTPAVAIPHSTASRRTVATPARTTLPFLVDEGPPSPRPGSVEFEPNRPDFKALPSQTSRMGLKAGEYGDNVAEYGEEGPLPRVSTPDPARTVRAKPPSSPEAPIPALQLATNTKVSGYVEPKLTIHHRIMLVCIIMILLII